MVTIFRVQSRFFITTENDGVMVLSDTFGNEYSTQDKVIASHKGMKYFPKVLKTLENVCATNYMKGFLCDHIEFYHIIDKIIPTWEIIAEREGKEAEAGSGSGGEMLLDRWFGRVVSKVSTFIEVVGL